MIQSIENAEAALRGLCENLLVSYRYDRADCRFELVTDYPVKTPGSDRAFLRFTFIAVSDFERIPGGYAAFQGFAEAYSHRGTVATAVVQRVHLAGKTGSSRVRIEFGTSFGAVAFNFGALRCDCRSLRASEIAKGSWAYRDAEDGTRVDFYDPFR